MNESRELSKTLCNLLLLLYDLLNESGVVILK